MDIYLLFKSIEEKDRTTIRNSKIEKSKKYIRKGIPDIDIYEQRNYNRSNVLKNKTANNDTLYNSIYTGLLNLETSFELDGHYESCDEIDSIYQKVTWDHPELFYSPYKYNLSFYKDANDKSILKLEYPYTIKEIRQYEDALMKIKEEFLNKIRGLSYEQIIDYTYQYTMDLIEYDHKDLGNDPNKDPNTYNIIGAFFEHTCVCAGYAKTFQYLMQTAGYSCDYISGYGKGEKHAWNSLDIDGNKYYFDATWDDNRPKREYYQLNYQQISKDHRFNRIAR